MTEQDLSNDRNTQASETQITEERFAVELLMPLEDAYRELNGSPSPLHGPDRDEAQLLAIKTLSAIPNDQFESTLLLARTCFHGRSDELKLAALEGLVQKEPELGAEVASALAFSAFEDPLSSRTALLTIADSAPENIIASCLQELDRSDSAVLSIEAARLLAHISELAPEGIYSSYARYAAEQLQKHEIDAVALVGEKLLERVGEGPVANQEERSAIMKRSPHAASFQDALQLSDAALANSLESLKASDDKRLYLVALAGLSEREDPSLKLEVMNGLLAHHPVPGTPSGLTRHLVSVNTGSSDSVLAEAAIDHEVENLW